MKRYIAWLFTPLLIIAWGGCDRPTDPTADDAEREVLLAPWGHE